MRKAYDAILADYVDAESAGRNDGSEPYRYECACCWEEVRLCAANSRNQATHFRHYSGNNNIECDNYLGNPNIVIKNALSRKNVRDKIEFYFSNSTKTFSVGVKFSAEDIESYEQSKAFFQVKTLSNNKPIISIPINSKRFLADVSEFIPINDFSWEYYVSSTNDMKQRKYELFHKDKRNTLYPSFFKIQASGDDDNFRAKLVRTETLYTNTPYLIIFAYQYNALSFQNDVQVGKVITFSTMNRNFIGVIVTFTRKTAKIEQQLDIWKFKLEINETLTLLWPPSPQVDDIVFIKNMFIYMYSSFEVQAHGNINVNTRDIVNLGNGVSKISIEKRTKIHKKNWDIVLDRYKVSTQEYDTLILTQETSKNYVSSDDTTYLFNHSGVLPIRKGKSVLLTFASEVRHYSFGYLDHIITATRKNIITDDKRILQDILKYYKREEDFERSDYESLSLNLTTYKYIESCKKSGKINSAAKRFIKEGRI